MSIGMEDKRVPPNYLLEKVLDQVKQLAGQKTRGLALRAAPQKVPAGIKPEEADPYQDRNA